MIRGLTAGQQTALGVGIAVLGAWLVHEANEGRGRRRPFLLHLLPV
jgi:hypothetical protein